MKENYKVKSPILFLIFNRPDVTSLVFEAIKKVQPSRLYIAADGPRKDKAGEVELCKETRKIVDKIEWDCEVKTLFRDDNFGCKYAVSSGISWFFENEEEGIILEDDCLPNTDFFFFCDTLLDTYRADSRIKHIGGCNFHSGNKYGDASYYFSNLTHVWGWASWRRVWKDYDVELTRYENLDAEQVFESLFGDKKISEKLNFIYHQLLDKKINTWDYQYAFSNMFNNGLTIIPNVNLILNIGFRSDATHTFVVDKVLSNMRLEPLLCEISHPSIICQQQEADILTLLRELNLEKKVKKAKHLIKLFKFWKKH